MAARGETQANVEVSTLVVPAWRLRWRAPELALVLGERALALASARHDEADRLRAESLVVFACNRVGRGVRIADRAIDALKAAEAAGEHETAWLLRVELAACARSVGAPLTGFAAVTPVLEAADVPAELRASALVQASECLVTVGRGDEPTQALAEADQLYVADTTLDDDTRLLLRGLIRAVQAAQHRRWGDIAAAIGAAREGLDLLGRFADPSADSGQGLGRLTLELVLALMDANRLLDASEVGAPLLDRPVRAPSASTSGWLRLALATRVHLPAGRVALAREMLREAAASAERHQLDTLLAESLLALAHVHELSGELADALTNLRSAHAAERRRARAVYAVRARLAAEFSGVHRQPADLHQQLAGLLRPIDGMQLVTDGVLSAALKQQLRQWRPVQVRKGDGLKVKRVRRAAEDMTVEGLSAARQHAADRWRMVQPFGEPDDKTPEPLEQPPAAPPSSDRTVPASGLIASAGAMVSGRRRAARVAAGEIEDDDQPTTTPAEPPTVPAPEPQTEQLSPEQERKRKVEQQLMELQREARRQIEAERQARAEQRAAAEREAAEEAARQEAARQEAARQEAARLEAVRQESARQEAARQEAARQAAERDAAAREEAARTQTAAREETSRAQPESVLDMLKAQGLRAGGRRRAPDTEASSDTPSWRVEPPARLRQDDQAPTPQPQAPENFSGGTPDHPDAPNYLADPSSQDRPSRSGLSAAFGRPPAAPDFGPHVDDPAPAYPLYTPASGFPATSDDADERKLPERDYTNLDFSTSPWSTASVPSPEPAEPPDPAHPKPTPDPDPEPKPLPLPPIPDPIPSVPVPDEIPQPPEPDLLSSTFLSSADVEPEDDTSTLPTTPVRADRTQDEPTATFGTPPAFGADAGAQPGVGNQSGFGTEPGAGAQPGFGAQSGSGAQPTFGTQTGFGAQPTFGTQTGFGTQPTFGTQTGFGVQPTFGSQTGFGAQPDPAPPADPSARPEPNAQASPFADAGLGQTTGPDATTTPEPENRPDPAGWANFEIGPDFDVDPIVRMSTAPATTGSDSATQPDFAAQPGETTSPDAAPPGAMTSAEPDSPPEYDFFATESAAQPELSVAEAAETATEAGLTTPTDSEPTEVESGTRTSRPSSRRKPSDLSLADLLAEALVAYETGRRSDEEQLEASDLAAQELTGVEAERSDAASQSYPASRPAEAEPPAPADQYYLAPRPAKTEPPAGDSYFDVGQPVAREAPPSADSYFNAGRPVAEEAQPAADSFFSSGRSAAEAQSAGDSFFNAGQPVAQEGQSTDPLFRPGQTFGSQEPEGRSSLETAFGRRQPVEETPDSLFQSGAPQPAGSDSYFLPTQPPAEPRDSFLLERPAGQEQPAAETPEEKTGPIVPVGAASDSETTGPIRPVRQDGPAGWTLPGA